MYYIPAPVSDEKVENDLATYLDGLAEFYRNK